MSNKEPIKIRLKRISGIITITVLDLIFFSIFLVFHVFNYISLEAFTSSFIEIIGVLLGLTFTSYAILLGIIKNINYSIRKTKGFGIIGDILFLTIIDEIIALIAGLMLLTIKGISSFNMYIFGLIFILFSVLIVSYVLLMVYYMTLIFHSLRIEEEYK